MQVIRTVNNTNLPVRAQKLFKLLQSKTFPKGPFTYCLYYPYASIQQTQNKKCRENFHSRLLCQVFVYLFATQGHLQTHTQEVSDASLSHLMWHPSLLAHKHANAPGWEIFPCQIHSQEWWFFSGLFGLLFLSFYSQPNFALPWNTVAVSCRCCQSLFFTLYYAPNTYVMTLYVIRFQSKVSKYLDSGSWYE